MEAALYIVYLTLLILHQTQPPLGLLAL